MDTPETGKDQLVQGYLGQIKDWNIEGILPADLELADGKKVSLIGERKFYDHGTRFGGLDSPGYGQLIHKLDREHPDANILTIFPYKEGDSVVRYRLDWMTDDINKRYREEGDPAKIEFLMSDSDAKRLLQETKDDQELMDRIVAAKFPALVQNRQIVPWKELIYLPPESTEATLEESMEIIARR